MEASVLACGASVIALAVNIFHPKSIPFIATDAYETMVPCPVQEGHVTPIAASASELVEKGVFLVDAREESEFHKWHPKGALLLTYDFLDPIPPENIREMAKRIAAKRATKVLVYGDGANPDTGELLGIDISAAGINNVFYIKGGADALKAVWPKQDGRLK